MNLIGEQSARQGLGPFDLAALLHLQISCRGTTLSMSPPSPNLAQLRRD
jgi:hypothetical protein